MFKAICLIRRKPGMTMSDFIDRYENGHAVLCAQLIPGMVRYLRRYVQHEDVFLYPGAASLDFDVVTELWYESRQAYDNSMQSLEEPAKAALLLEDEKQLFDLTSIRRFVVDEGETSDRSEEHTSELQSLMRISYAVFCLKKK